MALNKQVVLLLLMTILASFVALSEQAPECPANSTMAQCGNRCERNCADPPGGKVCPMICGPTPACACNQGYSRNSAGQCVLAADCPPRVACNLLCRVGLVCVVRPVPCLVPPCPVKPQCVPPPPSPSPAAASDSSSASSSSSEEGDPATGQSDSRQSDRGQSDSGQSDRTIRQCGQSDRNSCLGKKERIR